MGFLSVSLLYLLFTIMRIRFHYSPNIIPGRTFSLNYNDWLHDMVDYGCCCCCCCHCGSFRILNICLLSLGGKKQSVRCDGGWGIGPGKGHRHKILKSFPGRIQLPCPSSVNVFFCFAPTTQPNYWLMLMMMIQISTIRREMKCHMYAKHSTTSNNNTGKEWRK